jgi:hypothetical protein
MQYFLPSPPSTRTGSGGFSREWLVRSVCIFGTQHDHRCLRPVRVLFDPQMKTHEVPPCRTLSVDLNFANAPKDLITTFVDCLARLPNLRTLEIFSTTHFGPITRGLKLKSARFPGIRELRISDATVKFVGSCPNVESVIVTDGFSRDGASILSSYGKELRKLERVIGVNECYVREGELRHSCRRHRFIDGISQSCARLPRTPGDMHQAYSWNV